MCADDRSGDDRSWDSGWDAHARAQRQRLAQLTLIEKLAWLEEAQRLARHLRQSDDVTRTMHDEPTSRPREGDER